MKLFKFRVRSYKSIVDSGDCYPAEQVTILAGKNEAGKSSLLEALEDFNIGSKIRDKAIPIGKPDAKPMIEVSFHLGSDEMHSIIKHCKLPQNIETSFLEATKPLNIFTVAKTYPDTYQVSAEILNALLPKKPNNWDSVLSGLGAISSMWMANESTKRLKLPTLILNPLNTEGSLATLKEYETLVAPALATNTEEERVKFNASISELRSAIETHAATVSTSIETLKKALLGHLPNFVLFSAFDDIFPNEIPLGELESNKWIKDLAAMSDLEVTTITGQNRNAKKQHKHQLNLQINSDFSQFWTQDLSKLSIDWDSERLEFWIEEQNNFYPPELRSQGRRWHLAFYIRVSARARGDVPNIILIDEPGLYLHATAQRDVLKHLEDSSQNCQVIISTHSPYLIEPEKLDRIRLVQKSDSRGTYVENKIHAVSDKETLTPILTAIGLELNQGIVAVDRLFNVVVEGPSDYFYLTAFKEIFKEFQGNFISGGSAGNMAKVGTILQGWGCRVIYLFDNDQAFKDAQKSMKKDWVTISKDWLSSLKVDGSIEDIFTKEEYAAIIGADAAEITEKNSAFMKANKRDKVLPSRLFLQKVRAGEAPALSDKTQELVKSLFSDLNSKFDNYSA